jgi:N-acetylmuramoyl-L-alanine amidase
MDTTTDTVARTLWGEARGDGIIGMTAVACVIRNRYVHPGWWGHTLIEICTKPYQFSCWLSNDPNKAKLLAVTSADHEFNEALTIAATVVDNSIVDITSGATYYKTTILPWPHSWGPPKDPLRIIGHQSFYRL